MSSPSEISLPFPLFLPLKKTLTRDLYQNLTWNYRELETKHIVSDSQIYQHKLAEMLFPASYSY